jgi:hypothetical protein
MDAALNGFDVGHIAIAKTALEEIDPLIDLNMPILQLMENLKIEVIQTVPKAPIALAPPTPVSIPDNLPTPPPPTPAAPPTSPPAYSTPAPSSHGVPMD